MSELTNDQAIAMMDNLVQMEASVMERDAWLQLKARLAELEAGMLADCRAGYIEVSKMERTEGYNSLRFADVRAGWLISTENARRILGWDYHHIADIDAAFDEAAAKANGPVGAVQP
jgi:hypothetical protein